MTGINEITMHRPSLWHWFIYYIVKPLFTVGQQEDSENGNTTSDLLLFNRLAGDDHEAFTLLYNKYSRLVYTRCLVTVKNPDKAKDITQEVFARLWRSRGQFRDIENPVGYFHKISYNALYSYLRDKRNEHELVEDTELLYLAREAHTEEEEHKNEQRQLVAAAVAALPARRQKIYLLRTEESLNYQQIAEMLHISKETVKASIKAALKDIRAYVARHAHHE